MVISKGMGWTDSDFPDLPSHFLRYADPEEIEEQIVDHQGGESGQNGPASALWPTESHAKNHSYKIGRAHV